MRRFLFTAIFTDGSKLAQTQEDKSKLVEGKNVYYDVLHSDKKLAKFILQEQVIWNPTKIEVDLQTGIITINGVKLYPVELPIENPEFELYWMMNVKQVMQVDYKTKTGDVVKQTALPEIRTYMFGWITKIGGQEYKQILSVK